MQSSVVETLTGAAVIVIAGVFLFFAYTATDTGGGTGYDLTIDFDRVDGLAPGADVRLSGRSIEPWANMISSPSSSMVSLPPGVSAM